MANVEKLQSTSGIFVYPDSTGSSGTTEDQYMEWEKNHHNVLEHAVHVSLWQPDTDYKVGEVVASPNMVANTVARASTAGHSSTAEPSWTKAGNSVADGTVTWLMMPRTLDFATDSELTAGTVANKIVSPKTLKTIMDTRLSPKLNLADLTPSLLWDVLHSKGENFVPSDVTNAGWQKLGAFISYYTSKVLSNQPSTYGQLINICATKTGNDPTQLWLEQSSGKIAYRGGNNSKVINDTAFTYVATAPELASVKSSLESSISSVNAKAGIIAGNVSNANSWWVKIGGTIPLIIQGGLTSYYGWVGSATLTFPVAFNTAFCALTSMQLDSPGSSKGGYRDVYTLNNSNMVIGTDNCARYWIAFGI